MDANSTIINNGQRNIKNLKADLKNLDKILTGVSEALDRIDELENQDVQQILGTIGLIQEAQSTIQRMESQLLYGLTTETFNKSKADTGPRVVTFERQDD